ncbi:MAG TPA: hypothetical protein VE995_05105 [Gaiellaceae bacterium]|nr:hypothetical protein [Gaiellaceae bacterium]
MRNQPQLTTGDVQTLENVLDRLRLPTLTRRALLGTAAGAAVSAAIPGIAGAANGDAVREVGTAAVTAEALAVTYLSNLIRTSGHAFPPAAQSVLKAANAAEQDHYTVLHGLGFTPLTTTFWLPNLAFNPRNAAAIIEYLESVFVNAYLIGTTVFAAAGNGDFARYTVEIGAVEAEHRTLARVLQGKLGDNLAYSSYTVSTIPQIVPPSRNSASASASEPTSQAASSRTPGRCPARPSPSTRAGPTSPEPAHALRLRSPKPTEEESP